MQVRYFVQSLAKGKYAVDAELSGNAAGCKLYSPDAFGPANEFFAAFSHFNYVDACGKAKRPIRSRGRREIELPAAAVRFSYKVSLGRRRSLSGGRESAAKSSIVSSVVPPLGSCQIIAGPSRQRLPPAAAESSG